MVVGMGRQREGELLLLVVVVVVGGGGRGGIWCKGVTTRTGRRWRCNRGYEGEFDGGAAAAASALCVFLRQGPAGLMQPIGSSHSQAGRCTGARLAAA